jgi:hypothetical protein
MKNISILTLMIFIISACEQKEPVPEASVIGVWEKPEYSDSLVTYKRATLLPQNDYSISFYADGSLTERKNSGWCGTPPIVYGNFDGTWHQNQEIIYYTAAYWGGTMDITWEIITVNSTELKVKIIESEVHEEE